MLYQSACKSNEKKAIFTHFWVKYLLISTQKPTFVSQIYWLAYLSGAKGYKGLQRCTAQYLGRF
jgi:hypothetical protein